MTAPVISIIVPNFNYGRYLEATIKSIVSQTFKEYELIIVDDGSQDNSIELIKTYFPWVKLITQPNRGVNSARNEGIHAAQGELIALCDADDLWLPKKLEKQVTSFSDRKTILVGTHVVEFEEEGINETTIKATSRGNIGKNYRRRPGVAWIPGACSSSVFLKSSAIKAGLFDEELRGSGEDWEFFARLAMQGNFDFVDETLVKIRKHGLARSSISLKVWYQDNKAAVNKSINNTLDWSNYDKVVAKNYLFVTYIKSLIKYWIMTFRALCVPS